MRVLLSSARRHGARVKPGLLLLALLVVAALGCEPQGPAPVAATRSAVEATPALDLTLWSPPEAPRQGEYVQNAAIVVTPVNQEHAARLQAYLKAADEKEREWRAAGVSEPDIARQRAELKAEMLRR